MYSILLPSLAAPADVCANCRVSLKGRSDWLAICMYTLFEPWSCWSANWSVNSCPSAPADVCANCRVSLQGLATVVEVEGRRYCCEDCPDTDPSLSREASMAVDDDLQGP
jgi:hypothetical protein